MAHERTHRGITFDPKEGRTQKSQAAGTDITTMINKYMVGGQQDLIARANAVYGEFADITDYQTSMESLKRAESAFNALPSDLRTYFDNDPGHLVEFMAETAPGDANHDEAVRLKLVTAPPPDPTPKPDPEPDPEPEPREE